MTKIISKSVSISTLDEGVTYEIQTSVDSVTIPSNQSQTVLSSAVARFFKKEGDNEKVAYNSPYSVYLRSGNTYTFIRSGTGTMCQMTATIASSHDAIVVYLFNDVYTSTSPENNPYVAKKEIKVVKNGNDGNNAVHIDLSNEADMIACDSNGKVRFSRNISTEVRLYDGAAAQTISKPTVVVRNAAGNVVTMPPVITPNQETASAWTLTWAFTAGSTIASSSYDITVSYDYNTVTYSAKFTLTRTDASAIYQLHTSKTEIAFNVDANNNYTPSSGTVSSTYTKYTGGSTVTGTTAGNIDGTYYIFYRRLNGSGVPVNENGVVITGAQKWFSAWGNSYVPYDVPVDPSKDISYVEFCLTTASAYGNISDTNIIDRETIPIVKSGKNGADGKNAVRIDLSNENDMIACDAEEHVRFDRTIQTTAIIYNGSTPVQSVTSIGNVTLNVYRNGSVVNIAEKGTYGSNGVTFSFAFKKGDVLSSISYPINISIVYNDVTYTTTFTISRTDATAIYQLYPSLNEIAFGVNANNEFVPAEGIEITCGYTKHTGDGAKSYSGEDYSNTATSANDGNPETWMHYNAPYNIFFRWDNSGLWAWLRNQSNAGNYARILVPANTVHTSIEFAFSSSGSLNYVSDENILDRETIPIIKSGKKGEDGEDGENVVRVDLDNEMDSMLYDNNNNKLSGNIVSHARLYDGVTEKTSDATWALTASGCTISSSTGSTITVTAVSNVDATVTATATYNSKTYSAVMSIKKIVNQDKYDLDVTPNALTLNTTTGWGASKTITIKVMCTPAGGGTPTAIDPTAYGLDLSATLSGGSGKAISGSGTSRTISITQSEATNNENVEIVLFKLGDSSKVYDRETVPFNKSANGAKGDDGQRGQVGRFYYYAGEFDKNNNTDTFSVSDIQVPFFSHGVNAASGLPNCHLFNYDTNGSYTMYQMWAISGGGNWNNGSWNNDPWEVMWNDQKYLITEAVFGNYAHFASAIITGDYLISQYVDALGFNGMYMQLNDNSKYIYVDTGDMFGEESMYADLSKFLINESYASSPKEINSTSYASNPYTSQFDIDWNGGVYCIDIRYLSAGGDLKFAIATSATASPVYTGTLPQFYVDEGVYEQSFFMFSCTPKQSRYRVYFKKDSGTDSGVIYWVKIRQAKFVPRSCQDMKSGKIATRNIIAKGELHAESLYYETILGSGNGNVYRIINESIVTLAYNSMGSKIVLPNPVNAKGRIIEIYSGIQDGTNNWFKLGYDAASSSTYFKNAIGSTGNYALANYSVQWKSTYIKLWCDGSYWYVLKDEHTVWVNDADGYRICLNNKIH